MSQLRDPRFLMAVFTVTLAALYDFALTIVVISHPNLPGEVIGLVNFIAGALNASAGIAVNYWLGTSASSREKDQVIAGQVAANRPG